MRLQMDTAHRDGCTVLSPRGEIDSMTGPRLEECIIETLVGREVRLVIDLTGVDFMDSTGLGALVGGRRRAEAVNGSLSLVCVDEQLLQVLRITGLDTVFAIFDTVEAAVTHRVA